MKRECLNCTKWNKESDPGATYMGVCVNPDSPYYTHLTDSNWSCPKYKASGASHGR